MFLLPRILFIVCWWARFDTLASWVDWFPLHSRPLFVMCLCYSVLCGTIALIPLGSATHLKSDVKYKQASFLSYQQNDGRLLHPDSESPWAESTLNDFRSVSERGLAQMVERPLSMREAPGSIPGFSNHRICLEKKKKKRFTVNVILKQHFLTFLKRRSLSHTPVQFSKQKLRL